MSLLTHFLIATLSIAGLILLRMFAERQALRGKLRGGHVKGGCEQLSCFRDCDPDEVAPDSIVVSKQNLHERSANHAH